MSIINTKGVEVFIQVGSNSATDLTLISISKASPSVVEVSSIAGLADGDVVSFSNTGFSELDGKTFAVGNIESGVNSFSALGSDTTKSTGILPTNGAKASVVKSADMVKICLSSMEIGANSVSDVDVSTFCDPTAQLPGKVTPGTIALSGYADKDDTGLAELIKADEDRQVRAFEIVLPGEGNGYIVGKISLAGLSYTVPIEGAVGFTVNGTQASKIKWVY
jgi:hypothetical protein